MFISILYMLRATVCSSSGESIVSIWHLVYVTLCRWPSGMQVWMELRSILYMFRATMCSSSGESVVSIWHLVYVTLCRWPSGMQVWVELHCSPIHTCIPDRHLQIVTYTRCRIYTTDSPDDEHMVAGNM